ncbi:lycopene beta-cyclase CrtY [Novosphingobium lentum]|uniref:lycopene beta-cyclase CrtY n=1 Tax=Novosphingobium lentum TaxID=145287 RepID=UPI00082DC097|nr:lycopene beta-cyclase CrtY [Novosphingobium lentum]
MTARRCDIAILGGGLAGGLIALALARQRPDLSLLLVEQDDKLGGNHVWSFFGSDVRKAGRDLLAPLVVAAWPAYDVRFPAFERRLGTSYYAITSDRLDDAVRKALPVESILTGARVLACTAQTVSLVDGTRIEAGAVIDARGIRSQGHLTGGWQKFVGRRMKLAAPHGIERPIVMDAGVDQIDGFRFVYCLPFGPDEIFIEDTYYSDSPHIEPSTIEARIDDYVRAHGWQVIEVLGEEQGVLPVVAGGDFDAFWRSSGSGIAHAGGRAGLFHPVTSYSLPAAVRFALAVAARRDLAGDSLASFSENYARRQWEGGKFYRALSAMLFSAAVPHDRYRVLERFYRLDRGLIERFYAGRSTLADKFRVLAGRPPVPLGKAIGVLTGLGEKPQALTHASTRR